MKIFFNPLSGNIDVAPDNVTKNIFFEQWSLDGLDPIPLLTPEFNRNVFMFAQGADQVLKGRIRVMSDYFSGQIIARISIYTPAILGDSQWELKSYLHKISGDMSDNVNTQTQTTAVLSMVSALPYKIYKLEIPLTDGTGKINEVQIGPDDTIDFQIKRLSIVNDVDDSIRLVPLVEFIKS